MLDFKNKINFHTEKSPNFCGGLKQNLRIGEKILREFNNEFGHLESSTKIQTRLNAYKGNNPRFQKLLPALEKKADTLQEEIYDFAFKNMRKRVFLSPEVFIDHLKAIMKTKQKANCWEDSIIINDMLLKNGQKPSNIEIEVFEGDKLFGKHFTTVIGLKKEAFLTIPETWGSQAVIVDAWKGIVMQAHNALAFFKKCLSFNPKTDTLKILDANLEMFQEFDQM